METFGFSDFGESVVEPYSAVLNFGICDLKMTATFGKGGLQEIRYI